MPNISKVVLDKPLARYALAVVVVAASFLLRWVLVQGFGLAMPTFITFYPGVMLAAVLGGLWSGVLATVLVVVATDYFILPPFGNLAIASISDAVALLLFAAMGVFMSLVAEHYRRSLRAMAVYKSEQAQWESKARLEVALASMTDAVFISDTSGQFIQFNDAFATFCRFRNKAECSRNLSELREFLDVLTIDGELVPLDMRPIPRALRGETATNAEYRLRRKDTGEIWLADYSFAPLHDRLGVIIGSVVVARDITERKRTEEELRKSETLYHGLFDSMDEAFCIIEMIFDAEGKPADYRFLEINAAFEKQTGLHDAVGKRMRELAPAHEEYWFEIYGKIALTGEPEHFLNEAKALNAYYEVHAYRVGEPELRQVAIVFSDISERIHTQEALKRSGEQLQIFFEHAPASLAMFDLDMRYICASRRWSADYGLGDRDLRGVSHYDIFPEIPERWKEAHRRALAGEVVQAENDSFVRADGSLQRLRWEIHPWHEPSGAIGGIVVFTEDITERKRAEEHIAQLNRVYAVLSDINQTIVRVKDSQAMLEAACRIAVNKGQFLMAFIGMADPAAHMLRPIASSGEVGDYLDHVQLDLLDPARTTGPSVQCFLSGEHAVCNAIEQDPRFAPWRDNALRMGYRSHASFPLKVDAQVIGIFNLYSSEPAFFDEDETKLLDELAMDISFALEVNQLEERRLKAEEHVKQLNRLYSVLSDVNQTIVREKDSRVMLESACRIAVERGEFRMAWIGMVDPDTKFLEPIASSGVDEGFLNLDKISVRDTDHDSRPVVRCIASGKHTICNDIEQEIPLGPLREESLRRGYLSGGSFPLKVDGQTVGAFNLYANEKGFFEGDDVSLLDEMAMDISHALEVNLHETARQEAEVELRRRTAFFEAQVDSSPDGILVIDRQDRKILQNQRMNDIMQIPKEIAEDPDDLRQREYVRSSLRNPDQFIEKIIYLNSHPDEVCNDEVELLNGTIVDRRSSPVRDKAGNHYGRIWTFRDITERRQLEEQFRQSQKMEAVGQLTGGIAHDFNNLLTVILGCSEFIGEEAKENPRLSKMAKMIMDAAQRGADLTHRMLAFARRQALQPKPVDIHRMLTNMESILRRTLSADIDMEVIKSGEDCTALVDLTQLENALLNLCVNARDAMPGGGKLIVETGIATLDSDYAEQNADVTPGQYILISVSDTGCGISRENLDRVFDPFFTTKEVGKGTGLGLSMVYGFVKQSQGHVKIYSEPGKGTSVNLYLPMADQKSEPSNQEAILIADLHGSEVILLVEDNEPVREFAKTQLLHLGYQVLEAANGKDALAILREHPEIDLLFTDVVMPGGLNGRELAQGARKIYPSLKVLFCSGYAESAILHLGLLDEHVQLLNKPYSRLQLAKRIRGMLTASLPTPAEEEHNG
jgi:PAS domain S-box-containing protein